VLDSKDLLKIEDIEIELFIKAIKDVYDVDFSDYRFNHIKRRLNRRMNLNGLSSISEMIGKTIYDKTFFEQILLDLSINVTEMFRCPGFYNEIRKSVIPILKTYPKINIWHAGCSTGEEVFSMAILLKEEGLLSRANIFASDFNQSVLDIAKEGIYSAESIKKWTENYQASGGKYSLSDYYQANYKKAIFDNDLIKNVKFINHNLVSDFKLLDANLIVCRNVLIYFDQKLQDRVIRLFLDSLKKGGVLGLGVKEGIRSRSFKGKFEDVSKRFKIYQKKIT